MTTKKAAVKSPVMRFRALVERDEGSALITLLADGKKEPR